jgi:photosystem II stability/assembly factor-like uncharacterized protein
MSIRTIASLALVASSALHGAASASGGTPTEELYHSMAWRSIGPFRGGRSVAVAGVASDTQTYYFGSVGGGVFKTSDAGVTWENVSDGQLSTSSVGAIAVAPSDPNVVYVGMGEHSVRGVMTSHGDGVYRSTDAGRSWTHVGLEKSRAISRIQIHPTDPDRVWIAVQGAPYGPSEDRGVYRSLDGGTTWEKTLYVSESAGASELAIDPTNPRILYAALWDHTRLPWQMRSGGPGSGLHRSTDGGASWSPIGSGLPKPIGKLGITVSANPQRLYAIVEADPAGGLYRSDDSGKTFALMADDPGLHSRAWYYMEVFADPEDPDEVWVLNAWTWKSTDGGRTFTRVVTPHGDNHDLWINPEDRRVMINANDGGANISFNGGRTWSTQSNQPTGQFYRVNTDDLFPYNIYGGQQDNSTVAIASQTAGGGIGWKDWYDVGGCESAFVAFAREQPDPIYAGCYMGLISEWDRATRSSRNIMADPTLPAALPPKDVRYRFNWNAPILVSLHDSRVIYHAANVVLRSQDRGGSWAELSPDLTRNERSKQGPGGRPITNEGAGGETYGTIAYLAESPHSPDTLWAGSDDGRVHVTRDAGASWQDVTPKGMGEALVNAIEVSPHAASTVYIAVTRYKFDDFTPQAYKTTDFGATWTGIASGIPEDAWVRVVREDVERPGLLYMGTEAGPFVSFDAGDHWQSLRLKLPLTPITDLRVAHGDLVASTAGRGFWILDDLSPLRQSTEAAVAEGAFLFAPRPAYRVFVSSGGGPSDGKNPPPGATIDFLLEDVRESGTVVIEILDAEGEPIRRYESADPEGKSPPTPPPHREALQLRSPPEEPMAVKEGMNRISWDLRHERPERLEGAYVFGSLAGRKAAPGGYSVRLSVGETVLTRALQVLKDPRVRSSQDEYVAQEALVIAIERELEAVYDAVERLRDARGQIESLLDRAKGQASEATVTGPGRTLADSLVAVEEALIQSRTRDGQTVIGFPARLNHHLEFLRGSVDDGESGVTEGQRRRFADLQALWATEEEQVQRLLGEELRAFNALAMANGIAPVWVPQRH